MDSIRDRLWEKAAKLHIPLTAAFELLPVCNLSCRMCYVRKSLAEVQAAGGYMSGEEWLEIADEFLKEGLLYPLLTGGEPLLHPDFQMIFQSMQQKGLQISVNSNGTLIDHEMARWFGSHIPTRINITLYGASEETYEALCGNGAAYEKVMHAIECLKAYNVPMKFNTSITNWNKHELDAMHQLAKKLNVPIQTATYMFPPIRRHEEGFGQNDRLSPEEAGHMRARADYLKSDPKVFLGIAETYARFLPYDQAVKVPQWDPQMKMQCRAGNSSVWINWQGEMINCGMYGSVAIPLKGRSVKDAWQQMVRETTELRYEPACAQCVNRPICHPCISMVYNESGDVNGRPEYICKMNEAASKYYVQYAKKLLQENPHLVPVRTQAQEACLEL